VKLNEFIIDFVHRSSIQSQALAYFIVDWTPGSQECWRQGSLPPRSVHLKHKLNRSCQSQRTKSSSTYTQGSSSVGAAGKGLGSNGLVDLRRGFSRLRLLWLQALALARLEDPMPRVKTIIHTRMYCQHGPTRRPVGLLGPMCKPHPRVGLMVC
jgi:hypothetical protein